MATKKKTTKRERALSAPTRFVLSLPRSVPIADVIERARTEAGLTLSRSRVSKIRFAFKDRVAEPAKKVGALTDQERDLLGLVLDIGYSRAAALLDSFRVEYFDALKNK
jgi:hypothetical protein